MFLASAHNKETGRFQPTKIKNQKSDFGAEQVLFLGKVFRPGEMIINLNNYKNAIGQKTLPETGAALKTVISFLNYFSMKIVAYAYKSKNQ